MTSLQQQQFLQQHLSPLSNHSHQISDDEVIDEDDESHNCRRCDLPISEGHAYELGGDRWHMYCFSCSKCSKLLGTSSNFLVLGTGDLICSDCSYACNACGKKIDDLAILTGDQAYCSSCFCCRNCKKRIEDLRYARTSKGLFCMACHEKLLEKKKRHEQEKKLKQLNRTSKQVNDKSLPKIPPQSITSVSTTSSISTPTSIPNRTNSPDSSGSEDVVIEANDNTIATVSRTSPKPSHTPVLPARSPNRGIRLNQTPKLDPPVAVSPSKSPFVFGTDLDDFNTDTLHITTPQRHGQQTSPFNSSIIKTPNGDNKNRKAIVVDSLSSSSSANNILASYTTESSPPPKVQPPQAPTTNNKRALENDDFIDLNDSTEDVNFEDGEQNSIADSTKYKQTPIGFADYRKSDHIPTGLNIQGLDGTHDFLGRKSMDQEPAHDFIKTPTVDPSKSSWTNKILSPLSPSPKKNGPITSATLQSESSSISRTRSIRSPKNFFSRSSKHKKSESASSVDYKISSPLIIESNSYSKDDLDYEDSPSIVSTPRFNQQPPKSAPTANNPSITSPYQQGTSSFQTPPVRDSKRTHSRNNSQVGQVVQGGHSRTNSQVGQGGHSRQASTQYSTHRRSTSNASQIHQRSVSDVNDIDLTVNFELRQSELELRSIRTEIRDLKQTKHSILKDITDLSTTKDNLNKEIQLLTLKLASLKNDLSNSNLSGSNTEVQSIPSIQQQQTTSQLPSSVSQPIVHSASSKNLAAKNPSSLDKQHVDKSAIGHPIVTELSPELPDSKQLQPSQPLTSQQKTSKAKFWKRGAFFGNGAKDNNTTNNTNGSTNQNISGSQSSYSLSNILNSNNSTSNGGNPTISAPLLKTEELDELGGNDNKKLSVTSGKYLDVGSVSSSSSNNGSTNALLMSDLFNSTLESRAIYEKRPIPLVISRLIKEVEKRGLDSEGIYRKSGATSQMNNILKSFNNLLTKETSAELEHLLDDIDINAVTSSLKRYLYFHLPEPVILNSIYDDFINVSSINGVDEKKDELVKILKTLPKTNLKVLTSLTKHLCKVESFKDMNKMNYHNLAVVFGPTLIRVADSEKELKDMQSRNAVMEFLLIYSNDILEKC